MVRLACLYESLVAATAGLNKAAAWLATATTVVVVTSATTEQTAELLKNPAARCTAAIAAQVGFATARWLAATRRFWSAARWLRGTARWLWSTASGLSNTAAWLAAANFAATTITVADTAKQTL